MNITLKKSGQARTQATAVFDRSHIDPIEEDVVQALGKEVKIKGFRPGTAPPEMLRENIPASRIQEEVVQRLVPDVMKEVIEKHKLQPIIRPRIELQSLDPFTIQVTVVEQPGEVASFAAKVQIASYPIQEYLGLIFVYLGKGDLTCSTRVVVGWIVPSKAITSPQMR